MVETMKLIPPRFIPPLDEGFRPAALANRAFRKDVEEAGGGEPLILALERNDGGVDRLETHIFSARHPRAAENLFYVERLLKFMLWQYGGWKVYIAGSQAVADQLQKIYSPQGERAFDYHFLGNEVYHQPFTVVACQSSEAPPQRDTSSPIGRHLDGCRIGFDLGASDLKVSAVVDGEAVFSQEIVWQPRLQADPGYHYDQVMAALRMAAAEMPRVDAIGGSSAGIYIDNQVMIASLFRGVPQERYHEVRTLFLRIRDQLGVPLEITNDGDVAALAGSMSLEDTSVLGVALGSSEAGGYVNREGKITGWLNELAFAPIDYQPGAPQDEWSQDRGVGAMYFSQQCVFRLAPKAGIQIPAEWVDADKLKYVQQMLESGHIGAQQIWESIGIYLGYGVAHYADFYDLKHVLILGRVTTGRGGDIILERAQQVLLSEFPELAERIQIQLPDEKSRRVGQAIAAASLPIIVAGAPVDSGGLLQPS
ncbi:MAG: ROK family protein [Anaerolineaceae bacterium]|nr:ROK family protein [Anaerolineaceae bacterium]